MNYTEKKSVWDRTLFATKVKTTDVGFKEMAFGYFLGPFCVLMMTSVISSYYLTFYRTYEDVVAQGRFLTLLPLVSVIPMTLANIVTGILVGKTKTKAGKARPYILAAAPILLMSGILIFCIPHLSLGVRMAWMAISYNLFAALANPIYGTSHYLMVSLSTRDLKQRGLLSVVANIPAVAGNGLVSSILMPVILSWINSVSDGVEIQNRWKMIMVIFSVMAFLGCILEYKFTRERITEEDMEECERNVEKSESSVRSQLQTVMKDRYWWIVMIFYALYQAGVMFKGGYIFNIFCHEYFSDTVVFGIELGADMVQSVLALISGIPLAAGMLFIWPLANKFGKKNMIIAGLVISIVGSLICISDPSDFMMMLAGQTLKGFSSIPGAYVMMALFADVLDHLEAKSGYRVDGVSMSVYNTILTVINGLAIAFFNFFYDNTAFSAEGVAKFFFLGFEVVAHTILIIVMSFLTVEKGIEEEQKKIAERKGYE